jgi:AraC family transcriptional regulator, carnitine catabolism transcriptional activator
MDHSSEPEQIGFLLLPEFPIYAVIPAVEALRIANQNRGRKLYDWQLFSTDGRSVRAGNGMSLSVDASIREVPFFPTVLVCAGNHPLQNTTRAALDWIRRLDRHGAVLGAIDTGVFALARAGVLDGHTVTLHWEAAAMFRDGYPDIQVREQLFVIEERRMTCAGGIAALDLMLELIQRRHGPSLAQVVANGFIAQRVRQAAEPQRLSPAALFARPGSPLDRVLHLMKEYLDRPLKAAQLAERAGIADRTLNRLVKHRVGETPMRHYRKMRLAAARNALFYSELPIQDVAASCGFSSSAVFCRVFRSHFGMSPGEYRRLITREQLRRFTPASDPELRR